MIELSPEVITIVMGGLVLAGVLTGFPIAYVFGIIGVVVGYTVWGATVVDVIYARMFGMMTNYVLLAVPLFVFMGYMLERSGIAERMYDALYVWLGGFRGGLAMTTVLIGTIMAACVGIIGASVTMLGLIALPSMIKRGYSRSLASGSVCAGGTLGILIPPSIMLVVYGPTAGISVGKLFFGAFMPGFVLSALYLSYIALRSFFQPEIAPSVPVEERVAVSFIKKTIMLIMAIAPTALLIMSVLGVIFFGIAPPSEAAGIGAFAAFLLTVAYRRFSFNVLKEVTLSTMKTCGFILIIATTAVAFTIVFIGGGGGEVVENFILGAPGGKWGIFAIIMFVLFILGMFMDWMGIVFIMVPILTPIVPALGFDTLWFSIMVCVNLQMSFMTPPFAYALFYLRGCASPELGVTTADIIRGVIPFVILIMVGIGLCIAFPQIILWLPGMMLK